MIMGENTIKIKFRKKNKNKHSCRADKFSQKKIMRGEEERVTWIDGK